MRWQFPLILIAVATLVFVSGVGYGVVMVGVPTQDPTPAITAAEARDVSISGWAMLLGACLGVVSLLWFAVIGASRGFQRPPAA